MTRKLAATQTGEHYCTIWGTVIHPTASGTEIFIHMAFTYILADTLALRKSRDLCAFLRNTFTVCRDI